MAQASLAPSELREERGQNGQSALHYSLTAQLPSHQGFRWPGLHLVCWLCLTNTNFQYDMRGESRRKPCLYLFWGDFSYLLLERGREGETKEKERERNINVWLPLKQPLLGTQPAAQAHNPVLTGKQSSHLLLCRTAVNLLSHTSQDESHAFRLDTCMQCEPPCASRYSNSKDDRP